MMLAALTLATVAGTAAPASLAASVELTQIGHIASKGRVQDTEYNQLPVVDALINAGPAAIPFLVGKLEDETEIRPSVLDFWPRVRVGDVALVILCDFFRTSDWKGATIPGFSWDLLLERPNADVASWGLLEAFVARHGRHGLRRKVEDLLEPYDGRLMWDSKDRCFKPRA